MTKSDRAENVDHDVLVVGAGFAGINALYTLQEQGLDVRLVEAGNGPGGTWYWNRYPGARVDIESLEYSYGFHEGIQQEWSWSEKYAGQPEVRRYLEWVTDRLDLRERMTFGRRVVSMTFDDSAQIWTVRSAPSAGVESDAIEVRVRYVVLATGFLSAPNLPPIPGMDTFDGKVLHTGAWPSGVDLAGKSVGVIGTAASGVQLVQNLAGSAGRLSVFQRTANWCFPLRNQPMDPDYEKFVKSHYSDIRRLEHESRGPGMVLMDGRIVLPESRRAMDVTVAERLADFEWRWRAGGVHMGRSFSDLITDDEANAELRRFLEEKIRSIIDDPATAEALIPDHPPLSRRPPGEAGYYEAFNRSDVELVDIKSDPIDTIIPTGVRLDSGREFELDAIVCATGFDSGTGAALRIDIRGREDARLSDHWADGARTYLGVTTSKFPNLFFINGPQSPGPHFSPPLLAAFQSKAVAALIECVDSSDAKTIEPQEAAEKAWNDHANEVYGRTLIWKTDSWWVGANIPGKPRQALAYGGGFQEYKRRFEQGMDELEDYQLA